MTTSKRKRMSMLDNLAASGKPAGTSPPSPATTSSMMSSNRALRSARDAVDGHHVWELDPGAIVDDRLTDRLDPDDVIDLRDAIEANGQTVPILVRRHPADPDRYLLVYGRRRLEAIRLSDKVTKVKALVASMDDKSALRAQISENMARRDLSFIEKALFARELIDSGFGTQSQVAEVLTVTKSSISMALAVVESVGEDLIRAIGAAHGIGRPRWEALGKVMADTGVSPDRMVEVAEKTHLEAASAVLSGAEPSEEEDISVKAFLAVENSLGAPAPKKPAPAPARVKSRALTIAGKKGGQVKRSPKGLMISLESGAFADWVDQEAQQLINELHGRWLRRTED